jgi:hypothetical protein
MTSRRYIAPVRTVIRGATTASCVVLLGAVLADTAQAAPPTTIKGTIQVGSPQETFTVNGKLKDNQKNGDRASGTAGLSTGATGPIVDITAPVGAQDYYCINVRRTDGDAAGQPINFYIRDTGDGVTTFDQWQFLSGLNVTCADPPQEPFITANGGNIVVR